MSTVYPGSQSEKAHEDVASSDLSYLSDIEEEATDLEQHSSSALNTSQLDAISLQSETGCFVLDWRAEMTPGTVSELQVLT